MTGPPADSLFAAGNAAYARGHYAEAVAAYQQAVRSGRAHGALYHNLGNAYAQLQEPGEALWAYARAEALLGPTDGLRHNQSVVHARLPRSTVFRAPLPAWYRATMAWPLVWLFAGGLVLGCAGGAWGLWRPPASLGRYGGAVTALVGALVCVSSLGLSYAQSQVHTAIVLDANVPLRSAAQTQAAADTSVSEGTVVRVLQADSAWAQVEWARNRVGWLPRRALGYVTVHAERERDADVEADDEAASSSGSSRSIRSSTSSKPAPPEKTSSI